MKTPPLHFAVLVALLTLVSAFMSATANAAEKQTFVLVHGATAGGWEWKRCGKFLADDGHMVYRATLTGLGERMHLIEESISDWNKTASTK